MAVFEITTSDGAVYEITAPDGMSEQEIQAQVQQQLSAGTQQPQQAPQQPQSQPSGGLGAFGRSMAGLFRGAADPIAGVSQLAARGANSLGLLSDERVQQLEGFNRQFEQGYQRLRGQQAGTFDPARMAGTIAATAPLAAAVPAGAGLGAQTGMAALTGGAFGAASPVENPGDDFWRQKMGQVGTGAAAGAVLAPVTAGLSRIISPKTRPEVKTLMGEGVTPTPGQILGGPWRSAEEKLKSVPILGSSIRNAEGRAVDQFNTGAVNRALFPIGKKVPKGTLGHDAVEFARNAISQSYDDVLTKIGQIAPDQQVAQQISAAGNSLQSIPGGRSQQFADIIRDQLASRLQNGRMDGQAFKAAEQNIGNLAAQYMRSSDADQQILGLALADTQQALRQWVERAAPPEAGRQLQRVNQAYAAYKRVERAAASTGSESGVFTPAALHSAVKALDRSKDKGSFARGTALMQDMSSAGKAVLSPKVPNSGTADRLLLPGSLGLIGPLAASGAGALPLGYGLAAATPSALYTRPGQATLAALLARRPELAGPLGQAVRSAGVPVLTPGMYGVLGPVTEPLLQP